MHNFLDFNIRGVTIGKAESEGALLLARRGVDPASFLEMQHFLPTLYSPYDEEPKFNRREYGHEANWTEQNARFCWLIALSVILRIQHARPVPRARDFYEDFEDVLTVTAATTTCFRYKGLWIGDGALPTESSKYQSGNIFTGRASGFHELRADSVAELSLPLEEANWIRLKFHDLRDKEVASMFGIDELWFRAEDVVISYQESALARAHRESTADSKYDNRDLLESACF